jgi:hypothetical protein
MCRINATTKKPTPLSLGFDLWSVTTICKGVRMDPFPRAAAWGWGLAAKGMASHLGVDVEEAKSILKNANATPWQQSQVDATRGMRVHKFLQDLCDGKKPKPKDDYEKGVEKAFREVLEPTGIVGSEIPLFHLQDMYAGTTDIIIGDPSTGVTVVDLKTHEPMLKRQAAYLEDQLQVEAYGQAVEWMYGWPVSRLAVLVCPSNGQYVYETFPYGMHGKLWQYTLRAYQEEHGQVNMIGV